LALHQNLRIKYPAIVSGLEMPGKIIIKLRKQLMENRRALLEKYIISLLKHEEICRNVEFRRFLCPAEVVSMLYSENMQEDNTKKSFFRNIFTTVDESFDTMRKKIPEINLPSMLSNADQFSSGSLNVSASDANLTDGQSISPTSNVIVDLLVELFELKEKNNWLRRQVVVLFLQVIFI
jgi:sorting nexin-25